MLPRGLLPGAGPARIDRSHPHRTRFSFSGGASRLGPVSPTISAGVGPWAALPASAIMAACGGKRVRAGRTGAIAIRRFTLREPFSGLSHLGGAVLSTAGLVLLLVLSAGKPWHLTA